MKIKFFQNIIDILRGRKKFSKFIFDILFEIKKGIFLNILSENKPKNTPILNQPVLFSGQGKIDIEKSSVLGWPANSFYSTYGCIHAIDKNSEIKIGAQTTINNNFSIVSHNSSITIGENCTIGRNFTCYDCDFHPENPNDRGDVKKLLSKPVVIENNVFIGDNVTILKGVTIGKDSIIGAGSVVTKDIPADSIGGGNPAKFIKHIKHE